MIKHIEFDHRLVILGHCLNHVPGNFLNLPAIIRQQQRLKSCSRIVFLHYVFPAVLYSNKGAKFESKVIKKLCEIAGVKKSRTTPYHPMGNGMVERYNKTLLNMLRTLSDNQKSDWKSHLSTMTHAYNATEHERTGYVPFT